MNVIIEINKTDHVLSVKEAKAVFDDLDTHKIVIGDEDYVVSEDEAKRLKLDLMEQLYV